MDKLTTADWVSVLSVLGMLLSIVTAVSAIFTRSKANAAADAQLKSDVRHIRETVEATCGTLAHVSDKLERVEVRLVRTEESCRSAHKRMDTFTRILPS